MPGKGQWPCVCMIAWRQHGMMQVCFSKAIIILYILLLAILAILYSESLNYYKAARDISYTNVKLEKAPPPVSSFNIPMQGL